MSRCGGCNDLHWEVMSAYWPLGMSIGKRRGLASTMLID
jgi:hypothetical protein